MASRLLHELESLCSPRMNVRAVGGGASQTLPPSYLQSKSNPTCDKRSTKNQMRCTIDGRFFYPINRVAASAASLAASAIQSPLCRVMIPRFRLTGAGSNPAPKTESLSERVRECNERIERLAQESYPQVAQLKQVKGEAHYLRWRFLSRPCWRQMRSKARWLRGRSNSRMRRRAPKVNSCRRKATTCSSTAAGVLPGW